MARFSDGHASLCQKYDYQINYPVVASMKLSTKLFLTELMRVTLQVQRLTETCGICTALITNLIRD